MKRSYRFVESVGTVKCTLGPGQEVTLPVFPGILKHPSIDELLELLTRPAVARKYTIQALRKAPWQVLREFPRALLEACLAEANLRAGRANALRFLLS
jgi:hypothetical protein